MEVFLLHAFLIFCASVGVGAIEVGVDGGGGEGMNEGELAGFTRDDDVDCSFDD